MDLTEQAPAETRAGSPIETLQGANTNDFWPGLSPVEVEPGEGRFRDSIR